MICTWGGLSKFSVLATNNTVVRSSVCTAQADIPRCLSSARSVEMSKGHTNPILMRGRHMLGIPLHEYLFSL